MQPDPSESSDASTAPDFGALQEIAVGIGLGAVRYAVARASTKTLAAVVMSANDPHQALVLLAADLPPAPAARLIAEASARSRTASFRARLSEQAGGMLKRREVADLLGVKPATVGAMQQRREILGVPFGREIHYPAAQFREGRPVTGLHRLLVALGDMRPWVQLQSLLVPLSGFAPVPTTMLELLRTDLPDERIETLVRLARGWAS